ncbi:DNA-binding protein [Bacillus sp. 7586-K]|nr:DNA-binding protein [Bacillus sp. 7586-K]
MDIDFFWVGLGLAALGYFIGGGLKNFKNPKGSLSGYPALIEEKDLYIYLGLSKEEVKDLLSKHPDAPKIELKGKTYYPYQHFIEWFSSEEFYKK